MLTHACERNDRLMTLLTISSGTVYLPLTKKPPSTGLSLQRAAYRVDEPTTWERLPSNCYRQVSTETTIKMDIRGDGSSFLEQCPGADLTLGTGRFHRFRGRLKTALSGQ